MAIAFDAVGAADTDSTYGSTSASWAHTCASGAMLYVFVGLIDNVGSPTATYNSSAMELIANYQHAGDGTCVLVFRHKTPTTGSSQTVAVSWTTAMPFWANSISYTGLDSTTPEDAEQTAENPAYGVSVGVTVSSATGDKVLAFCLDKDTDTIPADAAGTNRFAAAIGSSRGSVALDEYTGAASVVPTFTTGTNPVTVLGFNINAGTGGSIVPQAMAQYINQVIQ
jgi:hypothetical protein